MQKFNAFVARLTWFLAAMMTLVIMALPTSAQAQPVAAPPSAQQVSVQLAERESFASVYAGIIEGLAPEAFERCVRWGRGCPTALIQDELPSRTTLRTLRRLSVHSEATAPGVVAKQLQQAGALSAHCLMDTTVGSTIEQSWVRVHFRTRDLARHPWNPRAWFSHRCRDRKIDVRPGRDIAYTYNPREPEVQIVAAVQTVVGDNNPSSLENLRTAAQTLLYVLPEDSSFDVSTDHLLSSFRAFAQAAAEVPLRVSVIHVPTSTQVPSEPISNWRIAFELVLAVLAATALLGLWGQRYYYKGLMAEIKAALAVELRDRNVAFAQTLSDAQVAEFARGREQGIEDTKKEFAPLEALAGLIATRVLGSPPPPTSGVSARTAYDRLAAAHDGWNEFTRKIHQQGQELAKRELRAREDELRKEGEKRIVRRLHEVLAKVLVKRLGLKLREGRTTSAADLVLAIADAFKQFQGIHNRHVEVIKCFYAEQLALLTRPDTLGYGDSRTQMVLTVEQVRDLTMLLRAALDLAPESSPVRNASTVSPESIRIAYDVLNEVVKSRHVLDARLAGDLLTSAEGIRWMVGLFAGQPDGDVDPGHSSIRSFLTPEQALQEFQTAYALLFQICKQVADRQVDWNDPPTEIKSLVDEVLRMFHPSPTGVQGDYLGRAIAARTHLAATASVMHASPS